MTEETNKRKNKNNDTEQQLEYIAKPTDHEAFQWQAWSQVTAPRPRHKVEFSMLETLNSKP